MQFWPDQIMVDMCHVEFVWKDQVVVEACGRFDSVRFDSVHFVVEQHILEYLVL